MFVKKLLKKITYWYKIIMYKTERRNVKMKRTKEKLINRKGGNLFKTNNGISTRHNPYVRKTASTAGITLVALVVTIIVLIILAGVSISLVLGDNGIITKAREAKTNYQTAAENEKTTLDSLYEEMNKKIAGNGSAFNAKAKALNDLITYFKDKNHEVWYDETNNSFANIAPITNASTAITDVVGMNYIIKYQYSATEYGYQKLTLKNDDSADIVTNVEEVELDAQISKDANNRTVITAPFGTYYEYVEGEVEGDNTWWFGENDEQGNPTYWVYNSSDGFSYLYSSEGAFLRREIEMPKMPDK